jgi:uncharacterized surface protein with fasciclin (FAS1) repeats
MWNPSSRPTRTASRLFSSVRSTLVGTGLLLVLAACGEAPEPAERAPVTDRAARNSIVEVAQAAGQFSALLTAVEAAGLTETLESEGPFTVFAPTDGAFANLPDGVLDELLEDPEALSQILLYHVVPDELRIRDLREISELETAHGGHLRIAVTPQGLTVNDVYLLTSDVPAANGVIHVITSVLLPE